ncbi:penicillin acylase family protein [Actinoallomurus rhizosphaericola]|uniref:penicillin acylase family protein n=1 Tax=Actinoallomurus rhizosphaericola TaxID=2952536 RepID=UPI002093335C|nr:penicillin acylase family protein [Actinoallomurus rhizosphaericola]MCO5995907.1 penicillin acylase family protein [Actinoallomurus rhizosphaericola]
MVRFAPLARLPRPARWAVRVLAVLVALTLVLGLYGWWTVRRSYPQVDGRITVPGLGADVTVLRDRWGVPQIYADSAEDLMRAQGYVHAQDRFWEMDFRRHITAGRLSELFGTTTLDTDKVVRTLGWRRVAEQELPLLRPETRRYLDAYAQGVNAWLARHRNTATQSLEYSVLGLQRTGYRPEPWTAVDSLSWLKAMAWDLRSNMDEELGRAIAATKVSPARVAQLYPGYPYDRNPVIVPGDGGSGGRTGTAPRARALSPALTRVAAAIHAMPTMMGNGAPGLGSNSWVVSGTRTNTGKPLLANDPHLAPQMPSLWYQAGLHCRSVSAACPFDVTGFTFSGVPGVIIGHNARIAWGFTNLGPDVTDLYLERVTGSTYEYKGRQEPLQVRTEQIKVAGGKTVPLTVRATRHGPLLSDVMDTVRTAGSGAAVALRWTALDPGRTADAIVSLDTAGNWAQFRTAARSFEVPAQNLLYADVDGHIGYQAPGRIPIRSSGDGRWPAQGWTGREEWTGFIPFDELPSAYDPPQGYIVTANNAAVGPGYPRMLTRDWTYGYRAARIAELVARTPRMDVATMARIQMDDRNGFAPTLVPHLLRVGSGPAVALLRGWDFAQPAGSAPAAFYNAVYRHLLLRTFDDELPDGARPDGGDRWFEVLRNLLNRPDDPWWDDVRTPAKETRDDILRLAIKDAEQELRKRLGGDPRKWRWGDLHTLTITNQTFGTSGIGPVEWLFNRGPLKLSGGDSLVDATGWNPQEGYQVDWVPSMRMIADLADLNRSRWINLTGASGHAFAGHYWDQAPLWARGDTIPMRSDPAVTRREAAHTLTLAPQRR